jgi:DNA-binding LytR/AlgR family response regulator
MSTNTSEFKIRCIAVDDEPLALEKMKSFIQKVPFLELAGSFENGLQAIEFINANHVDLMFLDIQMSDLTGIQVLEILKKKPKVIFTTAYDQFALKGYELDVADYLLKPFTFTRFMQAVNKIAQSDQPVSSVIIDNKKDALEQNFVFIKTEYRMQKVAFNDILFIQGMKDYLMVRTKLGNIMTLSNFKKMEEMLPKGQFFRIHKSYLVPFNKIESIERNRIKIANDLLPISDTYREAFFENLKEKGLLREE